MRPLCFIILVLYCICLQSFQSYAQKQWVNWPGMPQGITFRNGKPESFTTLTNYSEYFRYQGGGTAYSDPATGQLKFIAEGRTIFNSNYDTVTNGYGLIFCDGSVRIVPFPNGENKFYIFHSFPETNMLASNESGLQTRCMVYSYMNRITSGLRYSILDMDKNNGLGEVIKDNQYLQGPVLERMALVKHANGKDVWLITHFWGTNTFSCFLINEQGIQPAIFNNIGPVFSGRSSRCSGPMDASPDGKRLAATSGSSDILELYDFNNATGIISNYREVKVPGQPGSVCFSPDNSKLYIGNSETITCGYRYKVYQVDFAESNLQESLFKVYESGGSEYVTTQMTRAVDNKIYMGGRYVYHETEPTKSALFTIDHPNQPKNACVFKQNSFVTQAFYSFPGIINDYVSQVLESPVLNFNFPKEVTVCFGTYTITAPAGYGEYRWSNGATTPSITVEEPGLYSVIAGSAGFSKPQAYGYTNVKSSGKNLDFGKDTSVCPKTALTLTIPYSYQNILWLDGDTSHIHRIYETSGKQRVTTIDQNGCKTWDSICVNFKYNPRAEFGNDTTLCNGQNLQLRLEPSNLFTFTPVTYLWQNGNTKDTLTVRTPGKYWGKVTYEGCTVSDTINVSFVNTNDFSLGKDTALCLGDSLNLLANIPNAKYEWSTGAATQGIIIKNPGNYWVKVNNGTCTVSDTIKVTFNQPPVVNLGNDTTLCQMDSLVLQTSIPNATYLWQDGSVKNNFMVHTPGTFLLQLQKDGCTVKDTINISYKPLPDINLYQDTTICEQQKLLLNVYQPTITSYLWQDGSANAVFSVTKKGTYWVKVKGINGCSASDTIIVNTKPFPSFSLNKDTTLCEGQTIQYNFNLHPATYFWNDQSTANHNRITSPGLYWLEVAQNGCSKRDSISIQYKPLPIVNLGNDTTLCEGASKQLNASNPNATYFWQDGSLNSGFTVMEPGNYYVSVNMNGCNKKDSVTIKYNYLPRVTLGNDTMLCIGLSITLNPKINNAQYLWQDGSTTQFYTVREAGTYKVKVTNDCGSQEDEVVISKGLCQIIMPNAFTPNNDGNNDVFRVKYPQFIKTFKMAIYNRWGEIIYESTDPYTGWNGMFKTLPQPEGNYIWTISLTDKDGISASFRGKVFLFR